ncbi:MAG: DUF4199 domain-containing protein [Pedobacter sp.]|nr:DUF4199 domain-containing protein [Pedobacter sp.]MDQ8053339.1 DUF4199 domain-containing protein [Pedobacter sp.]
METNTVNLKTEALKNGAIWGAINIVIFLVVWYAMPSLMGNWSFAILQLIIGITLACFFILDMRKKAGGYWTFGEALWNIFVMFLLSMAIMFVFNILFGKFIDPTYPVKMKEMIMANSEKMFEKFGMAEDQVAEAMQKQGEKMNAQFNPTFSQAIVQFGISAIFYFIGALIFALIFKKKNPNPYHFNQDDQPTVG